MSAKRRRDRQDLTCLQITLRQFTRQCQSLADSGKWAQAVLDMTCRMKANGL